MTAALAPRLETGPAPGSDRGVEARAIAATLACVARHGLAKTTIDDIAREAGCSRATLYRYFDSKRALVDATIRAEAQRLLGLVEAAAAGEATLEDVIVAMLECAERELTGHPALTFIADVEPERLLPHLTFAGGDLFLQQVGAVLAPLIRPFVDDPARAGEWIARVGLALWMSPASRNALAAPGAFRQYVHDFVVPGLAPSQSVLRLPASIVPAPSTSASPGPSRG